MLTAQRKQPCSKFTDRSLSLRLQDDSDALSCPRLSETLTDMFQLVLCTSCRKKKKLPTAEDVQRDAYCALKDLCPGLFEVLVQSQ